ncbi:MAG: biopolymer transporter ExbD [Candidatus Omnitrophota bacterium]
MKIRRRAIRKARVEMIPLIDSVFLILVFFIYAFLSMTVHRGLTVELPRAAVSIIDKKEYCAITVTKDDELFFNKQPITLPLLRDALQERLLRDPEVRVYINGDKGARHGTVVSVLDAVKSAGIEKVSIETEEKDKG